MTIDRQSARAILIDKDQHLLLIKRTKLGRAPYWTTPGGGIEPSDASPRAALHRELSEELGATARIGERVLLNYASGASGVSVQHFYLAALVDFDENERHGPELDDPSRGGYELVRVDLVGGDFASVDLQPDVLKDLILNTREVLLAELDADEDTDTPGDGIRSRQTHDRQNDADD